MAEFDGAAEASGSTGKGARKAKEKEVKPNAKHEASKAEKAAAALNGSSASAEAGPSGSNGSSSHGGGGEGPRKAVRTENGKVPSASLFMSSADAPPTPQETRAGEKRKRAQATDEITSDLDDSDEEGDEPGEVEGEDMVLCLYDKVSCCLVRRMARQCGHSCDTSPPLAPQVQRVKNKWKCVLKDGVASIDGRDYVFSKLTSDFEW